MTRRTGRGRLSSIALLPEEAGPIVQWAFGELRAMKRHQIDILPEFNAKLAALAKEIGKPIKPISLTAFNRQAFRLAAQARRIETATAIGNVMAERRQPGDVDNLTLLAAQTLKTLAIELMEDAGEAGFTPKETMELARALHAATSAESVSASRRTKVEKEYADKAEKAIDTVAKEKGLTKETVAAIKRKILGLKEAA